LLKEQVMKNLTAKQFDKLTHNAKLLADDEYGKKVLELIDHSIIKLFRVKRLISQATVYSPARRFAKNAKKLQKLGIPTISHLKLYNIKAIERTAVHYKQLEGVMVREYLQANPYDNNFLKGLGKFLAQLHAKGIFFRSAHFGNIIYTPENEFGLIDISDMSISYFSLGYFKRIRNLKHIFRIPEDIVLLKNSKVIEKAYLESYIIKNKTLNKLFTKKFLQVSHQLKTRY
jgi:tRNA A-37 threonylcarbamoyl transferase component Bud32